MLKRMIRFLSVLTAVVMIPALILSPGAKAEPVRVAALKGPTGMGMAHMIAQADADYEFTLAASPDELTGSIISGNLDIFAVPTNLAATLYQKTQGGVRILALNTLGVLYVLEKGDAIESPADLAGKTIVTSGQGSTPEYALNYILSAFGIQDATVEYKSEHSEVSALAASGMADVVMLPEPFVTALLNKDASYRVALDMTEAFSQAAALLGEENAVLSMGCIAVRSAFADENPEAVSKFMDAYAASVAFANEKTDEAAAEIAALGIVPSEQVAKQAIPNCHIVFVTGEEMKTQIIPFYEVLFNAQPKSVGGALPGEDFYYIP